MPDKFQCELISWGQVVRLSIKLARLIKQDGFNPDIIIAIGRGGYVPARLLADYLDMMNLTSIKVEHYLSGAHRQTVATVKYPLSVNLNGLNVLVVDDVSDSGDTFKVSLQHILDNSSPSEIRTCVLHHKTVSDYIPDYYAAKVIKWRWLIYPWAQVEDIGGFVADLQACPTDKNDLMKQLNQHYGIRVPDAVLEYIISEKAN